MTSISNFNDIKTEAIPIDSFWNVGSEKELKIHRIHTYPAKFPSFITTKALEFVASKNFYPKKIGDIFCGCGTTALEARRNNKDFWGCDINPVATLIAKVKSESFQETYLNKYYESIITYFSENIEYPKYNGALSRLQYWYTPAQYNALSKLKTAILKTLPNESKYQLFFLCAFSNILKPASKWLAKSIKPQIDPNKIPQDVLALFKKQYEFMLKANEENDTRDKVNIKIETKNFLDGQNTEHDLDMVITSPPYVTSYEYADLHQLSTLWLGCVNDYRILRNGTIGSDYCHCNISSILESLNSSGKRIVNDLLTIDKAKAKSVAKYYSDMQKVAIETYKLLNTEGYALFVIGNTEYKSVKIDNAIHLIEALSMAGFCELEITKRKISNKILTPYRDKNGKFSSDSTGRKIYNEEFIIVGKK